MRIGIFLKFEHSNRIRVFKDCMKKLFASLTAIAIAAGVVFAGSYPDISVEELQKAIAEKKVVVLDVNGTESFKKGHIPGAIDYVANKDNLAALMPEDKSTLVVAYCGSELCNAYKQGAKAAESLGYTNIKHLAVGLAGWKKAGAQLEKSN